MNTLSQDDTERIVLVFGNHLGYEFLFLDDDSLNLEQDVVEIFSYPMGDTTVRVKHGEKLSQGTHILVVQNPAPDVSVIVNWAQLLRTHSSSSSLVVFMPYLPSARGDKDVPNPALNYGSLVGEACSFIDYFVTVDPHSDLWESAFKVKAPHTEFRTLPLPKMIAQVTDYCQYDAVIAPDHGAWERAKSVADYMGVPVITADKKRDPETGKLLSYLLNDETLPGKKYLVVDDICDGGGTFALLATAVHPDTKLDLWVSHGGFTGNERTASALRRYGNVFTTNSLASAEFNGKRLLRDKLTIAPLEPHLCALIKEL